MPRRRRGLTQCRLHHITTRGNNRRPIFEEPDDRELFYDLLDTGVATYQVECHQDVQMGNHVHLLLEGDMTEVSQLLWFVSHRYALAFNSATTGSAACLARGSTRPRSPTAPPRAQSASTSR